IDANGDDAAPRDAMGTSDNGSRTDAIDAARDAPVDNGSIDGATNDRGSSADALPEGGPSDARSNDAVADTVTDVRSDVGTTDDSGTCGCAAYGTPAAVGTEPSSLTELSGLVASRKNPGVLYAHNDSGSNSTVVVMSDVAASLGSIVLSNVTAVDW